MILADNFGEETAGDQRMDADAQSAMIAAGHHADRLHGMVELRDADRHLLDKIPAGVGQTHAAGMALEAEHVVSLGLSADAAEGQRAFIEKRAPRFTG